MSKPKQKKTKNQFVKTIDHLIELCNNGHNEYAISLAGGIGVFSKKTIEYNTKSEKFIVYNHIDDSFQKLTRQELVEGEITNIGKAIPMNSLIAIID